MSVSLPTNETQFLSVVADLPYFKRGGYAIQLVQQHSKNPQLVALIKELLLTSPLSSKVPYPTRKAELTGEQASDVSPPAEFIDLQFPQTSASRKFVQRELALTMAVALDDPAALPIYMDALTHPSTRGRSMVVDPCIAHASDDALIDLYGRCVPFVQQQLREGLARAARFSVLEKLGVKSAPTKAVAEAEVTVLERRLKQVVETNRESAWNETT